MANLTSEQRVRYHRDRLDQLKRLAEGWGAENGSERELDIEAHEAWLQQHASRLTPSTAGALA